MTYALSELAAERLPKLLDGVGTAQDWEAKRGRIADDWLRLLGAPPAEGLHVGPSGEGGYELLEESSEDDHRRLRIRYGTPDGDTVTAFLLVPHGAALGATPAVLALHPTSPEGKADVALPSGRDNRRYGLELASRGYVVLAPDSITAGERVYPGAEPYRTAPFYERHPAWTAVGKMIADHRRAVDVLAAVPEADAGRIGAIGHSLGGYNGWFLAGLDRRVRAVASSCGFSPFAGDPEPNRWGLRDWFSHMPALTAMLQEGEVPFEWHEIAALVMPTPLFFWSGIGDRIFPNWQAIGTAMAELDELYRFAGAEGAFEGWIGPAGHDFPPQARKLAYEFLDRHLKGSAREAHGE
ncbi:dienelactone hydrolase family protein [Paenibacillus flagellatus]|uniref:Dipeptidyl aminopeptidase n=1 Tax=Paenibacillus flagellatus TaxID=2211139 RepID=A0A2V5KAC8_9BACL|nr:dienelactone hydrolase family protein [Paenibacillus flagellatus]PYI56555.1 dipeptidyl aminopeptidase [Paenibacillus flagellatus]